MEKILMTKFQQVCIIRFFFCNWEKCVRFFDLDLKNTLKNLFGNFYQSSGETQDWSLGQNIFPTLKLTC